MRLFILLLILFWFSSSNGQTQQPDKLRQPIPELPFTLLEDAGFDKDSIENLLLSISNNPPNDFRGLVVIKNNQIVIEEYFNTFWRNSIHDIRSAGKSVTALLLGIAIKDGFLQNLEQDVYSFFPQNKYPSINEDFKHIKLKHLLDMSSGLDADTDSPQTTGHASNWIARDNWIDYLLTVPLTSKPGEKWIYADINPLLISAVIEETSGMSLKDYAQKKLFDPLGIEQFYWYTNTANQTGAAGNLYLSTLDFAKIGVLVVNEGRWNNVQIIDPDFIKNLSDQAFDLTDNNPYADAYGKFWYKSHRTFNAKKVDYLFASGNGGNHLIVIPEEEMVIALTSSAYGQGYGHRRSYNIMVKIFASLE
jgi:CubicO group peptidase (beta-lactamase class C family)